MSPSPLRRFGPVLPPKMAAARRAAKRQRKILRGRVKASEREAMAKRLLAGTESGRVANGIVVNPAGLSRILAAFDGDKWGSAINEAAMKEAHRLRDIMVKSLVEQHGGLRKRFAPLSKATIALRRSKIREGGRSKGTKALIATGQMFKSISVIQTGKSIFVGIPRNAKRASPPGSMVNIALIQEHGFVKRMTEKQSRWFWYQMSKADNAQSRSILKGQRKQRRKGAKSTRLLIVPPRPFIGPSIEAWEEGLGAELQKHLRPRLVGG